MKILVLVPTMASLPFLKSMLERMVAMGWSVHYAASGFNFSDKKHDIAGVTFHTVDFPRGANPYLHFRASRQLNALVGKIQPDIVDVHFSAAMLTAALGRNKHWPPTLATVQGLRFPMQTGLRKTVERFVESRSAGRMSDATVLTDDDFQALKNANVSTASLQTACGFGCDLTRFSLSSVPAADKAAAMEKIGLDDTDIPFIYVGRKTAFKGYHLTVKAFLKAAERDPRLKLIVCGNDDPMHPSGLNAEEERIVSQHAQIRDLGWTGDVENYLAFAYANVFPSNREGMPVNLMESLAMGVPVITSNSRGCRDVVNHDKTGLVLTDVSEQNLAQAMTDLANNPQRRDRFSQNALASRDRFDQKHFVDERIAKFQRFALG